MYSFTQKELLEIINEYNSINRKIIKKNLKRIMKEKGFRSADIMQLGYSKHNTYSWTNSAVSNIPMFNQALHLAVSFDFNVKELIKKTE